MLVIWKIWKLKWNEIFFYKMKKWQEEVKREKQKEFQLTQKEYILRTKKNIIHENIRDIATA